MRAARISALIVVGALLLVHTGAGQSLEIDAADAEVWLHERTVRGMADGVSSGTLHVGGDSYAFDVEDGGFSVDVQLRDGENMMVACAGGVCSDTIRWTLGYPLRPEVYAFAEVEGRNVELHAQTLESPSARVAAFSWNADPDNPTPVSISASSDSVAYVTLPSGAPLGEYYFDLVVTDEAGNAASARTFVTVRADAVEPFDIWTDHASWVDRAVVYEVTPYIFEGDGRWADVTARLDEIAGLGINTLWIQPVFKTHGRGQGYDITNYFELRTDLGSADDLRELVRSAKEDYGMRVLFDFVPNHTSIEHPYARQVETHGAGSHYYDFYLTEQDAAPYSQHYRTGVEPFLYYFWKDLVILDWSDPEVYRWMMEAGRKWIDEFDIDGYRIDAVWGVNARTPGAMQQWRFDLKRRKPEIFLLGEDKATWSTSFEKRFDAAYDWYPEEDWVSHWTWEVDYTGFSGNCSESVTTIFNSLPVSGRSGRLRDALTNRGDGWHRDAKVFRFLQNNDTFPFLSSHGLDRTLMASTLLFALPGIPMIYNGQEIGHECHPYSTWQIFRPGTPIPAQDEYGLYEHYRDLAAVRSAFPVLYSDTFEEVAVSPGSIQGSTFAFRRWSGDEHAIAVVNMDDAEGRVRLSLPTAEMGLDEAETYYLTDVFSGDAKKLSGGTLRFPVETVPAHTTRVFILADHAVQVPTLVDQPADEVPARTELAQNYPNPFNPRTTIAFALPRTSHVHLRVFDVLGREVATLVDGELPAGRHEAAFDARGIASGMYFYRLETPGRTLQEAMIVSK